MAVSPPLRLAVDVEVSDTPPPVTTSAALGAFYTDLTHQGFTGEMSASLAVAAVPALLAATGALVVTQPALDEALLVQARA